MTDELKDVARISGDTLHAELWYPRSRAIKAIQIALVDVRAADGLCLHYDFERDGWVVEQASTFMWDAEDKENDSDWKEVAFIQAWARAKPGTFTD
jgi:hypothetical protein